MEPWYLKLAEELKETKRFERERVTARALSGRYHASRAISVLSHGECSCSIVEGYAALWPLRDPHWYELDVMKLPSHEKADAELWIRLPEIIRLLKSRQHALAVTDHAPLIRHLTRLGFVPINWSSKPDVLKWASELHIVCKLPGSVHSEGDPTELDGQKWLFVR